MNKLSVDMQPSAGEIAALHAEDLVSNLPPPENKRFYPALDGLRAVAVLMVFWQHYLDYHPALSWGWTGVDIFFVLSGFLITGILYDARYEAHRFRNFYVRRTLRIFPLFYAVLLCALLLNPIFHWIWHPAWYLWPLYLGNYGHFIWLADWRTGWQQGFQVMEELRSSLPLQPPFFLQFQHFWSLCIEEQFYLVWPPIVFLVRDRVRLRNLCIAVCFLSLAARIACIYSIPPMYLRAELLYRFTPLRADALLFGGLIALMLRGPEAEMLRRMVKPALFLFLVGFVFFEVTYALRVHHLFWPVRYEPVMSTVGYTLIDLFAGIVILISLEPSNGLYHFLTLKPLRRLGQMSYGFYIFHDIPHDIYARLVAYTFGSFAHSGYVIAFVALLGTLLLSYLSFRFFESPFLRLKNRFTA